MRVKSLLSITIVLIVSLFASSCASEIQLGKTAIYIVGESKPTVFVVESEDPFLWLEETKERRKHVSKTRIEREDKDEIELFDTKSKLSNVKRMLDGEMIIGFDKELDDPKRFREVE
jgi:hypothetical protein